jgi:two-component system secretion response regulator SsrB
MQLELSPKQQQVCDLVALGMTSKQVAAKLNMSHRTVDCHRQEIYRRLGVRNVIELVRKLATGKGE